MRTVICICLALMLCGCSDEPTWYDRSRAEKQEKEEFKQQLKSQGLSQRQADDAWRERKSKRETEGYRGQRSR